MPPHATDGQSRQRWQPIYNLVLSLLTDPRYFYVLAALVLVEDALLTQLIIRFVPCKLEAGTRSIRIDRNCAQTLRSTGRRIYINWSCT